MLSLSVSFTTDLWGCPPGYLMFEGNCYKIVRQEKSFSDAELFCQQDGGAIAKPVTKAQVKYLSVVK
jgi:hypothetical protein